MVNKPLRSVLGSAWRVLVFTLAMSATAFAGPEQAILGEWDVTLDYNGNSIPAELIFVEENGIVLGTWKSERGENELANIRINDGTLTFTRTISFQDQTFELSYEGKVDDGKLTGKFTTPMGDMPANGERTSAPEPPAAEPAGEPQDLSGTWDLTVESALGTNQRQLVINEGNKGGTYKADYGDFPISNLKSSGDDISFDVALEIDGQSADFTFEGTIVDGRIEGELGGDAGTAVVTGGRAKAAPATASGDAGSLAGDWELGIESPDGAYYEGLLTVNKDGSGLLSTELGDIEIPSMKIEGNKVSFETEADFGGVAVPLAFEGTVENKTLTGEVSLNFEGQEMAMPVEGKMAGGGAGDLDIAGEWELGIESPDGAYYEGLLTLEADGTGLLSTELGDIEVPELTISGNKVSFETEADFGGVAVPLAFSGTIDGNKLQGEVSLNFEGQEMAMPVEGERKGGSAGGIDLAGTWELEVEGPDGNLYSGILTVDASGAGELETEMGSFSVESVKVDGNKVSFSREIEFGGVKIPASFEGEVDGDQITGELSVTVDGQEMAMPVEGERTASASAAEIAGTWELEGEGPDGNLYSVILEVAEDGSADLESELGTFKIKKINVSGDQVSFEQELEFGGMKIAASFEGEVDGDELSGELSGSLDGQEFSTPVEGSRTASAPTDVTALVGKWELEGEGPDGNLYTVLLDVAEDGSAELESELGSIQIDAIKLHGDAVSFDQDIEFGGLEVEASFIGELDGDEITGELTGNVDGQEFSTPVEGSRVKSAAKASGGGDAKAFAGDWELGIESPDGAYYEGLLSLEADGTGILSTELGDIEVPALTISGNEVSFETEADFGGVAVPLAFSGKIDGEDLTGDVVLNFEGQEMAMPVEGKRKGGSAAPSGDVPAELAGTWELEVEGPDGNLYSSILTVALDGSAKLETEMGDFEIDKINLSGKTVTFDREIEFGGAKIPATFKGEIDGKNIEGELTISVDGQEMSLPVEGSQTESLAGKSTGGGAKGLAGTWNLGIESPDGAYYEGILEVETDGSGLLSTELGDIEVPAMKIDGNKVSFDTEADFGGVAVPLSFSGTVDGDKLTGEVSLNFEGQEMAMPVEGEREGGSAGGVDIAGEWDLGIESPDGAFYEGVMTFEKSGDNYTGTLSTDLGDVEIDKVTIDGNAITFATEVDFGGVMVPISFDGEVDGTTVTGTVGLNFDGQEMEMPVEGTKRSAVDLTGTWMFEVETPEGEVTVSELVIKETDGKLSGELITELGVAKIDDIKLNGNKFTVETEIDFGGAALPLEIDGTVNGDEITANVLLSMDGSVMDMEGVGTRTSGGKSAGGDTAKALEGTWVIEADTTDGPTTSELTFELDGDKLAAEIVTELGVVNVDNVKIDGNKFSFESVVEGLDAPIKASGELNGDEISGEGTIEADGSEMEITFTGTKL